MIVMTALEVKGCSHSPVRLLRVCDEVEAFTSFYHTSHRISDSSLGLVLCRLLCHLYLQRLFSVLR